MRAVQPLGVPLGQWALTVPFAWRKRLGYDGPLLSALTRLFVKTVLDFYRERGGVGPRGQPASRSWDVAASPLHPNWHIGKVLFSRAAHASLVAARRNLACPHPV